MHALSGCIIYTSQSALEKQNHQDYYKRKFERLVPMIKGNTVPQLWSAGWTDSYVAAQLKKLEASNKGSHGSAAV
jgi:predicted acyl esterase